AGMDLTSASAQALWNQAFAQIAGPLGLSTTDLHRLLQARRACVGRSDKLQRLEFRACDLGTKPGVLRQIRDYFGANQATAPKLETFYHGGVRTVALNAWRGGVVLLTMGRPPWPVFVPLPFWLGKLANPLTDVSHREAAHQNANFDVATMVPEFETAELTNPK